MIGITQDELYLLFQILFVFPKYHEKCNFQSESFTIFPSNQFHLANRFTFDCKEQLEGTHRTIMA